MNYLHDAVQEETAGHLQNIVCELHPLITKVYVRVNQFLSLVRLLCLLLYLPDCDVPDLGILIHV